ncbi:unnamed protein product [Rotaria magnacalcarata]|uniref:PARP catalytic domain-containing protein n=1 Tax=Rotaria magnacalcarata TaxID=392030 RepID=A0A816NWM1_9BILA|nr:unnamed protein product [Rotaria magnacalcarata]CAF2219199.1 unnamed protein product [Rotaria magnacalcarata]CAF3854271.1 unnamed protein product [Rotaria magnacalcarata]CAF4106441.1 unnamed protein product [Rotaria magnacalcarata]
MPSERFYSALPYLYGAINFLEMIITFPSLIFIIINLASTTYTVNYISGISTSSPITTTTVFPPVLRDRFNAANGLLLASIIVSLLVTTCCCLTCPCHMIGFVSKDYRRPCLRFISLNCNCPCYIPRPKLRFTVRLAFHIITIILRSVGVILFGSVLAQSSRHTTFQTEHVFLIVFAITILFPFFAIALDIYHYRVWWAYEPIVTVNPTITAKPLSPKHKRFIPYVLIEKFRTAALGNRKCKNGNGCLERTLEHIVIFHSADFRPQPRWTPDYPIYIGFHRTEADAAISIAHSDMRIGDIPPQMLGYGIYFARSIESTDGKARKDGAFICAEVRMGKVLMLFRSELWQVSNSNAWWDDYDTVYFKHEREDKDEFCVKSSEQVLRWVIYIEPPMDRKLKLYGMDEEFNDTSCHCV